jgi:FkbM family methyltransferase
LPSVARVTLPWGATVKVFPRENVGCDIYHFGIFDYIVPESIYRLADKGELAVEAGANIGQNCSLLAYKTGPGGRVIAFEPHPEIFEELKGNAALWSEQIRKNLQLENVALGETTGEAWLTEGSDFQSNRGAASISNGSSTPGRKHKVSVRRLDDYIPASVQVGVCKIDVEGHELSVLKGAQRALERRAIRDIIFEDFNPKPSPVTEFLTQHGFTLFELHELWLRPRMVAMNSENGRTKGTFSSNYLATLDSKRAEKRFRAPGWRCLLNL